MTIDAPDHDRSSEVLAAPAPQRRNIAEALAMPNADDIEFDPSPVVIEVRPADFS